MKLSPRVAITTSVLGMSAAWYAVIQNMTLFINGLGLASSLVGIACGGTVIIQNHRKYGTGHLSPSAVQLLDRIRRLFSRSPRTAVGKNLTLSWAVEKDSARPIHRAITEDLPVPLQLKLLVERVDRLDRHHYQHDDKIERLGRDLKSLDEASQEADQRVEGLAKEIAAGSARLEWWGLVFVGVGTVLLGIPPFLV